MNNKRIIYIIGVLLTLLGSSSFIYKYVNEKIDVAYEMMNKQMFSTTFDNKEEKKEEIIENIKVDEVNEINNEETNNNIITEYYIGYLEIPKINLYRGFVDINSTANNVQINMQVINSSNYPDIPNGNFILAAHSGNGYNAYFKDLYKLELDDYAYLYYLNQKYTYQIKDIYFQPKVGKLSIYKTPNSTTLTLITCTKGDESSQTVYILELINVE